MSHYRGELKGGGTPVTRQGSQSTGIHAAIYNWDTRVETSLAWDAKAKRDLVRVTVDGNEVLWMPLSVMKGGRRAIIEYLAEQALKEHTHGG